MSPKKAGLIALILILLLPLIGAWLRRSGTKGCTLDGAKIEPFYSVRIFDQDNEPFEFCCIRCAELWLARQPAPPSRILVTDEQTGEEIPAADAHYVRSLVVTTPATGNRVHVFKDRNDAEKHAEMFRGTILSDPEKPLRARPRRGQSPLVSPSSAVAP